MLQRWHSGDGCDLASTLYNYDLRKGDLSGGKVRHTLHTLFHLAASTPNTFLPSCSNSEGDVLLMIMCAVRSSSKSFASHH